jgi:prepilin-type N-terminal cleavage/methylation domain-containing protein
MGIKRQSGFTIVELLIVIVVIGVLAAIVIVAYNGITTGARDSSRMATLTQLQKAIEAYYATNGRYPQVVHGLGYESSCGSQTDNWGHCDRLKTLTDALAPFATFDPTELSVPTSADRYFSYDSQSDDNYQTYGLMVFLEGNGGANDGGYYSNGYEVGQNPGYCASTYTGTGRDWLNTSGAYNQRCLGGN